MIEIKKRPCRLCGVQPRHYGADVCLECGNILHPIVVRQWRNEHKKAAAMGFTMQIDIDKVAEDIIKSVLEDPDLLYSL